MSEQPKTRASLILRLRSPEDAAAWQEFVDIYQPLVYRLARARGLQDADAFDTTQEVLTRVAGAINRWDPDPERGSFRGWISRITRNLVIELMRSKNRLPKTSDDSSIQQIIQQTPGRSEESDLFDIADVATELEISTGAVYIARSRVMARLKQTVERYVSSESETQSLPTPKLPDSIEGAES